MLGRLSGLTQSSLADLVSTFLDGVTTLMRQHGMALLASCTSGGDLRSVETNVLSLVDSWVYTLQVKR